MIHLDTNFLIDGLSHGTAQAALLTTWVASGEVVRMGSIARCEFLCGPVPAESIAIATSTFGLPIPFTSDDATLAAQLFNASVRRRGSLTDCMIAAMAIHAGAAIATSNTEDFRRFEGQGLMLARL
jgi:predicted nucleic acid-binding protein